MKPFPKIPPANAYRLAQAAAVLLLVLLAVSLWPATLDDAFISYRYARNCVEGHGLVFNWGERVEGYSNLLWILVLTPFLKAGAGIEWVSKLIGLVCAIAALLTALRLLQRQYGASAATVLLFGVWLASCTGFVYYAISGLETLLYTLLLLLLVRFLMEERHAWAALASALLTITRPEGMLLLLPLVLCAWMGRRPAATAPGAVGQRRRLPWWLYPAFPVLFLALITLWRWSYYGALLPNTFNAKIKTHWGVLHYILWHSQTFVNYAFKSFAWNEWVLVFALFYLLFHLRRRDTAPAAVLGCLLFFVWFSGSDWMSFGRFYVPALPLLGLFAWAGISRLGAATADRGIRGPRLKIWLALPILFNLVSFYYADEELAGGGTINPAMHSRPHRTIGMWLRNHARPEDQLVVNEIGAIGWYSRLPIIDLIGLTDKTIPTFWKSGDFGACARYILSRNPRYIALNDRQAPGDEGMDPVHQALYDRMMADGCYRLLCTFPLAHGKNLLLFERQGP
ncbi:MAG TPA: hypothetical protein PLN61_07895 [bacterium]|nr:hypothetical protein [bacterium]HQI48575.1 hypothetical protein [bacterium]HQJ64031.1 hypothetical protein [bacterium]